MCIRLNKTAGQEFLSQGDLSEFQYNGIKFSFPRSLSNTSVRAQVFLSCGILQDSTFIDFWREESVEL
jgi:hypothetical protein